MSSNHGNGKSELQPPRPRRPRSSPPAPPGVVSNERREELYDRVQRKVQMYDNENVNPKQGIRKGTGRGAPPLSPRENSRQSSDKRPKSDRRGIKKIDTGITVRTNSDYSINNKAPDSTRTCSSGQTFVSVRRDDLVDIPVASHVEIIDENSRSIGNKASSYNFRRTMIFLLSTIMGGAVFGVVMIFARGNSSRGAEEAVAIEQIDPVEIISSTSPSTIPVGGYSISPTASDILKAIPTQPPLISLTKDPTIKPTNKATIKPTNIPTGMPTESPTESPTKSPTRFPTKSPTESPTKYPTKPPTESPTKLPTREPANPTKSPTSSPTLSPISPTPIPTVKFDATPTPIVKFDSNDIKKPVIQSRNRTFNENMAMIGSSNTGTGPPIFGGFSPIAELAKRLWSASSWKNGGLKIRWQGVGDPGEALSGLFMYKQTHFLGGLDSGNVRINSECKVTYQTSVTGTALVASATIQFVIKDELGFHISVARDIPKSMRSDESLKLTDLSFNEYDPTKNGVTSAGLISDVQSFPTFEFITWVGFRIDAIHGDFVGNGINVGVRDFSVEAIG